MTELVHSAEIIIPSGEQVVVGVSQEWGVFNDGKHAKKYTARDGLALATLILNPDQLISSSDFGELAIDFRASHGDRYEDVKTLDAKGARESATRLVNRAFRDRLNPVRNNFFRLGPHYGPLWFMLATDVSEEESGLQIVEDSLGDIPEKYHELVIGQFGDKFAAGFAELPEKEEGFTEGSVRCSNKAVTTESEQVFSSGFRTATQQDRQAFYDHIVGLKCDAEFNEQGITKWLQSSRIVGLDTASIVNLAVETGLVRKVYRKGSIGSNNERRKSFSLVRL